MNENGKGEGEHAGFDEVMGLLNNILKKVTDRGSTTLHDKLNEAVTSFHGELKRIDEELDKPDEEEK